MSRTLHASTSLNLQADNVLFAWIVAITFASGTLRMWSGVGDLVWGGDTYEGVGDLGNVSPITETEDMRAAGVELTLSGIPSALIGTAIGDSRTGKDAKIWLGTFDESWQLDGDPAEAFFGRVDQVVVEDRGETATIIVQVESRWVGYEQPRERRFTHEDQISEYPGDLGFEFVGKDSLGAQQHIAGLPTWEELYGPPGPPHKRR